MRLARTAPWLVASGMALLLPISTRAGDATSKVDFNRQIRPILSESCYQCHGPDQQQAQSRPPARPPRRACSESADGTTIVVPGKPDESELLERISTEDPDLRMPPPKSGAPPDCRADWTFQAMDCRGGRVERPLGLSSARYDPGHRTQTPAARPRARSTVHPCRPRPRAARAGAAGRPHAHWSAGSAST